MEMQIEKLQVYPMMEKPEWEDKLYLELTFYGKYSYYKKKILL